MSDLQAQYQRLIKNLSDYPTEIRDPLVKFVSATKTALDALDNKILDDKVTAAVNGFLGVVSAVNDVLEDIETIELEKAAAELDPACFIEFSHDSKPAAEDPVPVKRQKPRKNTTGNEDKTGSTGDDE